MLTNMIKLKIFNHFKIFISKKQKLLPVYLIRIYEKKREEKKQSRRNSFRQVKHYKKSMYFLKIICCLSK